MQKFKKFLFLFIALAFLTACDKESLPNNQIVFEHIEDYEILLPDSCRNTASRYDVHISDTDTVLYLYLRNDLLYGYSLTKEAFIEKINLPYQLRLFSFDYVSEDSIYVSHNAAGRHGQWSDSMLLQINYRGEIQQAFSYDGMQVPSRKNKDLSREVLSIPVVLGRLPVTEKYIYMYFSHSMNDSAWAAQNHPLVGVMDKEKNKFTDVPEIKYPSGIAKFNRDFKMLRIAVGQNENMIVGFEHSSLLYDYDPDTKELKQHYWRSKLVDSLDVYSNIDDEKLQENLPQYGQVVYDKKTNRYYRFICSFVSLNADAQTLLMVADSDMNYIAEGIYPKELSHALFINDGYLISWNKEKTFANPGKVIFSKYRIKHAYGSMDSLRNVFYDKAPSLADCENTTNIKVSDKNITDYLSNYIPDTDSSYAVIIAEPYKICPACVHTVYYQFAMNGAALIERPVYFILPAKNTFLLKQELEQNNLLQYPEHILIDSLEEYTYYDRFENKAVRMLIIRNRQVVADTIYSPQEMDNSFMTNLYDFVLEDKRFEKE